MFQRMSYYNMAPVGQFRASCPLCDARLSVEHDGIDLKGNERVLCPVHGDMGSIEEVRRIIGVSRAVVWGSKARNVISVMRSAIDGLKIFPQARSRQDAA
jgi:hypothetical protein